MLLFCLKVGYQEVENNLIVDIKNKLKDLVESKSEIQKVDLAIYYGHHGDGRGNTCIRIILPCDNKLYEEC